MSTREVFRYSWFKVTDDDGRAETMRAALDVHDSLLQRARAAQPDSTEAAFVRTQLVMARAYLGGEIEHGIRVVIFSPAKGGSLSLDLLTPFPHAVSQRGIEITHATMPSGYGRADALAWLETPVGAAWSKGALACRLAHAVVTAEELPPTRSRATASEYV
jgi:hypothetical protein